jgi:hypothetical protein
MFSTLACLPSLRDFCGAPVCCVQASQRFGALALTTHRHFSGQRMCGGEMCMLVVYTMRPKQTCYRESLPGKARGSFEAPVLLRSRLEPLRTKTALYRS